MKYLQGTRELGYTKCGHTSFDDAGLLTAPLLDPDQSDNNEIRLSGDFTVSWDSIDRQFLVDENGTPTGW